MVYDQPTTVYGGASDTLRILYGSYRFVQILLYTAGGSWSSENSWSLSENAQEMLLLQVRNNSGIVGNAPGFDCAGACLTGDAVTLVNLPILMEMVGMVEL